MNNFKENLITVTSKKFGTLFSDYAMLNSKSKISKSAHCSFVEGKTRVAVKSARAIKKTTEQGYLSNLIHSNEYCSITKDKFDVIIQQIQVDNFDTMKFFVCFDEGIYAYKLNTKNLFHNKVLLNYSGKQHAMTKKGLEGQMHLTHNNIDKVNELLKPEVISYNSLYQAFKSR
jgi:hypothetical protein